MSELPKVLLTIDMSSLLNDVLDGIAKENGVSKSEAIRRGIEYLILARQAKADGMTVGAWSQGSDGVRREREFVGIF